MKLYHYTSYEGCNGIRDGEIIKKSKLKSGDAILGNGVYLTSLPPWTKDKKLLKNNWGVKGRKISRSKMEDLLDRLEFCIQFNSKHLPGVKQGLSSRDVWIVTYDIDLRVVPFKLYQREEDGGFRTIEFDDIDDEEDYSDDDDSDTEDDYY